MWVYLLERNYSLCLAMLPDLWDLSSMARDRPQPPAVDMWSPNHCTTEFLTLSFLKSVIKMQNLTVDINSLRYKEIHF